jgi:hypothetical protein
MTYGVFVFPAHQIARQRGATCARHVQTPSITPTRSAILVVHEPFPVHPRDRSRAVAIVRDRLGPSRSIRSLPGDERRVANRRAGLLPGLARQLLLIPVDGRRIAEALHCVRIARFVDAVLEGIVAPAFGESGGRRKGAENDQAECNALQ